MSGQATGWVLRHGPHPDMVDRNGRPYGQRARGLRTVLVAVADAANADGHHAHPGLDNLIDFTLYSRRQVIALTQELEAEGWLVVEEQGGGRGRATKWTVVGVDGTVQPPHASDLGERCSERTDPPPEKVQSETEKVQSAPETVHSRVHPNGVATVVATGEPPCSPPAALAVVEAAVSDAEASDLDPVEIAFAEWKRVTGHDRAVLDSKRRRVIEKALAPRRRSGGGLGLTLDEVLDAIRGWQHSSWHRGDNDRGTVYDDLGLILRDRDRAERFMAYEHGQRDTPAGKRAAHERQLRSAAQEFLSRSKELTRGVS